MAVFLLMRPGEIRGFIIAVYQGMLQDYVSCVGLVGERILVDDPCELSASVLPRIWGIYVAWCMPHG